MSDSVGLIHGLSVQYTLYELQMRCCFEFETRVTLACLCTTMDASSSAAIAGKTFQLNNNVQTVDNPDAIYSTDTAAQREILKARPWKNDPAYFKNVRVAATALIKMVSFCCLIARACDSA